MISSGTVGERLHKEEGACFYAGLPYSLLNRFLRSVDLIPAAGGGTRLCSRTVQGGVLHDTEILVRPAKRLLGFRKIALIDVKPR